MSPARILGNFLQLLTAGVLTGIVYGLMCAGLSLIFRVMRVINFAQGEFVMIGMYVAYFCFGLLGLQILFGDVAGPYVAALAAGPVAFLIGTGLHRLLISQVGGAGSTLPGPEAQSARLVLTLGISLILSNAALLLFGAAPVSLAAPLSSTPWIIGPLPGSGTSVLLDPGQTIAAVVALLVAGAFTLLMTRSRVGRTLRAAADNPEAAIYTGIDVDRAHRVSFGLGVAIAAIGGGLLVSTAPLHPYIGIEFVIVMYAGVVLGGLGSIGGAFRGGLLIGVIRQLSALVLPAQLQNTAIFVLLLLIVLLKPDGLFARSGRRT